jgi:SAM-dependent methyltransferase
MPLNPSRVHLDRFVARAAGSLPPGSVMLDAGAGDSFYKPQFAHVTYESADFLAVDKAYAEDITYAGDLADLPVEDHRFDLVLLTQVLEHLPEPVEVLRELHRVLKPGSRIWASAPFYYQEHEQPYDFYRYTQFGLRHIFTRAGFSDVRVEWLEGCMATLSYQLQVWSGTLPRWGKPVKPALRGAAELAARSDVRRRRTDRGHPKNHTIVATA